ncbi:hypothetical protein MKX08_003093 [Trichoderma sp. CBMAI-0020]|nr:hypothetical protein MKX08_003093 [Trichoderma sp. CBMAI-0020]
MSDYASLKVPELKKLLAEKKLSQTGNKADLIARLQEADKKDTTASAEDSKPAENKEDEINYSDDEAAAAPAASKPEKAQAAEKPVEKPAEAPAAAEAAAEEQEDAAKPAEEEKPAAEEEAKEPAPSFAIGLLSSTADEELKKRVERAKRFGTELDDETQKLAERAKRFGINDKELASGLDAALPERSLKRGRGRNEGDGNRPGKKRSQDRKGSSGNERRSGRNNKNQGGNASGKPKFGSITEDPSERAKAEKRAARFAAA